MLEMHLKLKDQQLKTILFIYRLLYQNLMVTANCKSTIDTQKRNPNTTSNHKGREQRGREEKPPAITNPKQLTKWQ